MVLLKRISKPGTLVWLALLVLVIWALRSVALDETWSTLRRLRPEALLVLALLNGAILAAFSSRWWLILRAQGYRLPYLSLVGYRLVAFAASYFTPGTQFGGEPFQVYLTRDRHAVPGPTALAAVTLDRLLELAVNFTFLVFGVAISLQSGLFGRAASVHGLLLAAGLPLLPVGYLLALWWGYTPLKRLGELIPGPWIVHRPGLAKARQALISTAGNAELQVNAFCRQKPGKLFQAMLLSGLVWAALVFEYWLTVRFLGVSLNFFQTISALTAARLAFLLPLPAGLGALEASQVIAMQALGFNPALGISLSLLIRARDISFGVVGLWLAGVLARPQRVKGLPSQASD